MIFLERLEHFLVFHQKKKIWLLRFTNALHKFVNTGMVIKSHNFFLHGKAEKVENR